MTEERLREIEARSNCAFHSRDIGELIAEVRRLQDQNAVQGVALLAANEENARLRAKCKN